MCRGNIEPRGEGILALLSPMLTADRQPDLKRIQRLFILLAPMIDVRKRDQRGERRDRRDGNRDNRGDRRNGDRRGGNRGDRTPREGGRK